MIAASCVEEAAAAVIVAAVEALQSPMPTARQQLRFLDVARLRCLTKALGGMGEKFTVLLISKGPFTLDYNL